MGSKDEVGRADDVGIVLDAAYFHPFESCLCVLHCLVDNDREREVSDGAPLGSSCS